MKFKLYEGDNMLSLKKLPDNSIDSIVSDPPYGLSFMGKKWDYDVPSIEFWKECLRVLKPGGHVLSFGGTRTYHRMVVNMEDAGFQIRDQIMWIYGSGFPKSLNIGKQVDKIQGNEREVVGQSNSVSFKDELIREQGSFMGNIPGRERIDLELTKGFSPFEGQGTGLKPANEPICLARKPISEKTITENVLKWGTGGINVDGCRIGSEVIPMVHGKIENNGDIYGGGKGKNSSDYVTPERVGRFPANILFDEEAANILDGQSGISKSGRNGIRKSDGFNQISYGNGIGVKMGENNGEYGDKGGASRFFYVAKVSSKERNLGLGDDFEDKDSSVNLRQQGGLPKANSEYKVKNNHPTLKPINLMTYLCRLVTPKNGIILDPFMGSGSTGISALLEGFRFVGMEMDEGYFKIAESRIHNYEKYRDLLK